MIHGWVIGARRLVVAWLSHFKIKQVQNSTRESVITTPLKMSDTKSPSDRALHLGGTDSARPANLNSAHKYE